MGSDVDRSFLGSGWSFPLRINGRGGIGTSQYEQDIAEAIRIILSTAKGERRMRPNFGCGIHELMFSNNDASTAGLIRYHVEEALAFWEPRVEVREVVVSPDPQEPGKTYIDIRYTIKATNDERNLVYPFYLIPREG
ncbi:MAG: GPW/gp25 family protein [Chloroflexota bacterium]